MREIKFRGFDEENNCWRYGWYTRLVEGARVFDAIICFDDDCVLIRYYIHDDATIGQFTGLHDKNGVEIFEGDILSMKTANSMYSEYGEKYTVKYCDDLGKFECDYQFGIERYLKIGCEVIGNIHEGGNECTSATVE